MSVLDWTSVVVWCACLDAGPMNEQDAGKAAKAERS
jgi:hypothetical protein